MGSLLIKQLFTVFISLLVSSVYGQQTTVAVNNENILKSSTANLFDSDSVLEISLKGNMFSVLNDRSKKPKLEPIMFSYSTESGSIIEIPAEVKTRGHFRKLKENCTLPPLLLNFPTSAALTTSLFKDQVKLKIVMPCVEDDYIIKEWLVYKLYNLLTPTSFKTRLVRINIVDDKMKKKLPSFYGFLIEDENQMAIRNQAEKIVAKFQPWQIDSSAFKILSVFQYMIANTDWSVQYFQNIKLIVMDSTASTIAVPYDFDHAGIVNAPYAKPAEALGLYSIRERRYRGYCITNMKQFDESIVVFNSFKNDIYAVYSTCLLLSEKYKLATIKYLDEFYATINNTTKVKKEFGYPCNKNGTENVVIRGLKYKDDR